MKGNQGVRLWQILWAAAKQAARVEKTGRRESFAILVWLREKNLKKTGNLR
jgi:hypothetical protein